MALAAGASDVQHAAPYVPRLALERALAELSEVIGKTPACAALTGASRLGKTRLLHVLHERLSGGFESYYLSFPALEANEFWSGVSAAVGLGSGDEDRSVVLGRARSLHGDGSGLVLLIDNAGGISAERVNDLVDQYRGWTAPACSSQSPMMCAWVEVSDYSPWPNQFIMRDICNRIMLPIPREDIMPGDVALMYAPGLGAVHLGWYAGRTLIHASNEAHARKVVETRVHKDWLLRGAFSVPWYEV